MPELLKQKLITLNLPPNYLYSPSPQSNSLSFNLQIIDYQYLIYTMNSMVYNSSPHIMDVFETGEDAF